MHERETAGMGRRNPVLLALGLLFVSAVAILTIGNYANRQAIVHEDNGAVFYSYLYQHAQEFLRDPMAHSGVHWLWGSVCFWLPALAQRYLGLDPRFPDMIFFFLQIALLGLAVLILTWQASRSWLIAFASMALAYLAQPWAWNLAAYPDVAEMPLYTTLANGLAALSGAAFLARRWNIAWLLALTTAIVHPVIACYLLAMLAAWAWLDRAQWRSWMVPAVLGRLGLLILLCATPFLLRTGFTEPLLTPHEQWESVSKHMHSVPWANTGLFAQMATVVVDFLLLMALCWREIKALPDHQRHFLAAAAMGTLAVSLVQIAGALLEIPSLALTMGLRAFSNFILFAWPFLFAILFSSRMLQRFHVCFAMVLLGFVFYGMGGGLPLFHLALFALALFWPDELLAGRRPVYMTLLAALPLALFPIAIYRHKVHALLYGPGDFLRAPNEISVKFYLIALLASFLVAELFRSPVLLRPLRSVAMAGLLVLALTHARSLGAETYAPAGTALREAELWARDHTRPGTMFITKYGWRTLSERPAYVPEPDLTREVYTPFRALRSYNEFLFRLFGIADTWRGMDIAAINAACDAGYRRLKGADFLSLSKIWNAPYLVRAKDEPALDFPIVYSNGGYRIYRLTR